jgi:hypothetical protein
MRNYSRITSNEVIDSLKSNQEFGLKLADIPSLQRVHGLNKLEKEEKVFNRAHNLTITSLFLNQLALR